MGNYTIFPKSQERQASKKFYNKCSENSRSQIVFRTDIFQKLTLGAPELWLSLTTVFLCFILLSLGAKHEF